MPIWTLARKLVDLLSQMYKPMKKQETPNPYATSLKKLNVGQTASFNRSNRADVSTMVKHLNAEPSQYEYTQSVGKNDVKVTRVVPSNLFNRSLYIDNIKKSELTSILSSQKWSKEGAARVLGISARTIGRMISKHGITERQAINATKTSKSNKNTKNTKNTSKAKNTTAKSKTNKTR